jgi:beta-galactosidase GanA
MQKILFLLIVFPIVQVQNLAAQQIPHLQRVGDEHELVVSGKPFLMLGGELGNSTATTMESMEAVWPRLKSLNLNTILVPVYWELLEPREGEFDYDLVKDLIIEAREHNLKIVFLWFGAWKNSMSSHAPAWVKLDQERFPRAKSETGESQEILTPFSEKTLKAEINAYRHLLRHIKDIDAGHQTVILMQTENEIGMLPSARDHHSMANQKFKEEVPADLLQYLVENKSDLNPEFLEIWKKNGFKNNGSWEEVFGEGLHADEIFMAYHFARYTNEISAAGKEEYALPAFVNAALNRSGAKPGEYPSAGPLPHILDVWKAASPDIDFYAPDFYNPRFKYWNDLYVRQDNPLFVPEHNFDNTVAAKALYAIGHYEALGFSPFSIEQIPGQPLSSKEKKLAEVYEVVHQIKPILDKYRGQDKVEGVLLDKEVSEAKFVLGDYEFTAEHTFNLGWEPNAASDEWEPAGALIIQTGENEFYFAGFGVSLKMKNLKDTSGRVGILKTDLGYFEDGKWKVYQHLNGDQTHQGRHIRSFIDDVSIQRFTLYNYE